MAERRRDPTDPGSKKTYSQEQFIKFYGQKRGSQMWSKAGTTSGRRPDPTNPAGAKKTYTYNQFMEFYGESYGQTMWRKAGKMLPKNTADPGRAGGKKMRSLTEADVLECQANWAAAIKNISKAYLDKGDYIGTAGKAAGELYGYGHTNVLFKPTKAAKYPFRPTAGEAMSYFVGGKVVDGGYDEDSGFAINGGMGWKEVVFTNHQIDLNGPVALAMGSYVFTCATTGKEAKVEYTFGYKRNDDGKARIFLHHSSVPYVSRSVPVDDGCGSPRV